MKTNAMMLALCLLFSANIQANTNISFRGSLSPDVTKSLHLIAPEINLSFSIQKMLQLEFHAGYTMAHFDKISQNREGSSSNIHSEEYYLRSNNSISNILYSGLGPSYIFGNYHAVSIFANYYSIKDLFRGSTYQGLGPSFHWTKKFEISKHNQWGLQIAYYQAFATRKPMIDSESPKDRRMQYAWLTVGVDYTLSF